jgi:hypothetical protein
MNPAEDLSVLKQMASELKDYLLAEPVFWQMQGPSRYPKLSLGMLLLTLARLEGADAHLHQEQRAGRYAAARQVDAVLSSWQVAAEKKAARELHTRVNLWQRFWEDCADNPRTCAEQYPHDVAQRVIAGLLLHKFPRLVDLPEAATLDELDRLARGRLSGDSFVWGAQVQPGFPEAEHWYLYRAPAGT